MIRMILSLVGALVVLVGAVAYATSRGADAVGQPSSGGPVPVQTAPVVPEVPGWVGVVVPVQEADVAASVTARITEVRVAVGDAVKAGDVVASIDVDAAQRDLVLARRRVKTASADLRAASVENMAADDRRDRMRGLVGIVPEQERTEANLDADAAAARVAQAKARLQERRTEVANLERLIETHHIRAPMSGLVARQSVQPGAVLGPTEAIAELVSSAVALRVGVPATSQVRPGDFVRARCPDTMRARVIRVAPEIDPASGLVVVEAELDGGALVIGQRCRVFRAP